MSRIVVESILVIHVWHSLVIRYVLELGVSCVCCGDISNCSLLSSDFYYSNLPLQPIAIQTPNLSPEEGRYLNFDRIILFTIYLLTAGSLPGCHGKARFSQTWAHPGWESEGMYLYMPLRALNPLWYSKQPGSVGSPYLQSTLFCLCPIKIYLS